MNKSRQIVHNGDIISKKAIDIELNLASKPSLLL